MGPCVDVRGQLAGQVGAAAFVGIHGDGAGAGGRGFHVITSSLAPAGPDVAARSSALATAVRDAMTAVEPVSTYVGSNGLDPRRRPGRAEPQRGARRSTSSAGTCATPRTPR